MKNILVPIDFSETANNALEFALNVAALTSGSVTILNVHHAPLPEGEFPMMLVSPHDLLKKSDEKLKELVESARIAFEGKFKITGITREGFATAEILATASEINADLIILGAKGTHSAIGALFGSVTTEVMSKTKVPVLVIPSAARFKPVKKIVLAFDYKREPGQKTADIIKTYTNFFGADMDVLNIVTPGTTGDLDAAVAALKLENQMADISHHLYFISGYYVTKEIDTFIHNHDCDWLIVIPRKHGFFSTFTHRSISDEAVAKIHVPILSIHE